MCIFNILKQFLNNNYSLQPVGQATVILPKALRGCAPPSPSRLLCSRAPTCAALDAVAAAHPGHTPCPPTLRANTTLGRLQPRALLSYQRTQSLCETPVCLSGSFDLRAASASARSADGSRGRQTPSCVLPVPLQLSGIFQKGTCMLSRYPNVCDCGPGNTSRSPGSGGQWDLTPVVPQACEFTHFKSW